MNRTVIFYIDFCEELLELMAIDQYVKYCYHNRDKCRHPSNYESLIYGTIALKARSHQVSFLSLEEDIKAKGSPIAS